MKGKFKEISEAVDKKDEEYIYKLMNDLGITQKTVKKATKEQLKGLLYEFTKTDRLKMKNPDEQYILKKYEYKGERIITKEQERNDILEADRQLSIQKRIDEQRQLTIERDKQVKLFIAYNQARELIPVDKQYSTEKAPTALKSQIKFK